MSTLVRLLVFMRATALDRGHKLCGIHCRQTTVCTQWPTPTFGKLCLGLSPEPLQRGGRGHRQNQLSRALQLHPAAARFTLGTRESLLFQKACQSSWSYLDVCSPLQRILTSLGLLEKSVLWTIYSDNYSTLTALRASLLVFA